MKVCLQVRRIDRSLTNAPGIALVYIMPSSSPNKLIEMTTNDAATSSTDGMERLLQPWERLAVQLSPLIGESGFCALYGRAARLASAQHGWLHPAPAGKTVAVLLATLRTQFDAASSLEATRANDTILHTFTKLLTGLIGEALTMQLLAAAPAGEGASMSVQEQQ